MGGILEVGVAIISAPISKILELPLTMVTSDPWPDLKPPQTNVEPLADLPEPHCTHTLTRPCTSISEEWFQCKDSSGLLYTA